ncbi:CobW/HypB/UreG, nucleotide-binding domain-containing protein [Pavlovales sp. CCMP2436]|nr:CobW/HypB/UreG, nucleotide-binding domain-containing protein [Pavlovales sp. CCMP2436]
MADAHAEDALLGGSKEEVQGEQGGPTEEVLQGLGTELLKHGMAERKRQAPQSKTPITLLSGFLGAGKTTLLKSMLENKQGLRIGVVVNDVASVNIDAKLMKGIGGGTSAPSDTIELQNGCACCSAAEEFMQAIDKLVELGEARGQPYDHIVVESTGVAEPNEVRGTFQRAKDTGLELLEMVELRTLVTVVDASTFVELFDSTGKVMEHAELGEDDGVSNVQRKVVELLVEQVETADILVLNKVDQLLPGAEGAAQLATLKAMVHAMNPLAQLMATEWGKVELTHILGVSCAGAATRDNDSDLRAAVKRLRQEAPGPSEHAGEGGHAHGHEHKAEAAKGHAHGHGHKAEVEVCADPSHEHGHKAEGKESGHEHGHKAEAGACTEDKCTDPTHAHGHGHGHTAEADKCADEQCTDPTHSHGHGHAHNHASRHLERFGISSFVYARRRPFHPQRLVDRAIQNLPAKQNLALKQQLAQPPDGKSSPFATLVRSKGFLWLSNDALGNDVPQRRDQHDLIVVGLRAGLQAPRPRLMKLVREYQ